MCRLREERDGGAVLRCSALFSMFIVNRKFCYFKSTWTHKQACCLYFDMLVIKLCECQACCTVSLGTADASLCVSHIAVVMLRTEYKEYG